MATALITCTTPRSMPTEAATAWLERRAEHLRRAAPVEEVTIHELRPRLSDPVWLLHVVLHPDRDREWEQLLDDLVRDGRRLGMRPTVRIHEPLLQTSTTQPELQRAA
jgi:hypothetical protein